MRAALVLALLAASSALGARDIKVVYLEVHYKGINRVDPITFAYEGAFLEAFPTTAFVLEDAKRAYTRAVLSIECLGIEPLSYGERTFKIHAAQVKGKLNIFASDGTLRGVRDLPLAEGYGATPLRAEVDALGVFKKSVKAAFAKNRASIEATF